MEITLASVQYDTFDIDFQKVFDFMKNKGELENTVYAYGTDFGDNTDYYLEHVYGIIISYQDIEDYDCDELYGKKIYPKIYPFVMNDYILDNLYNEYYDWLDENKEKLGLIDD